MKWIHKIAAICTVLMLTTGTLADSVSEATATPTAEITPEPVHTSSPATVELETAAPTEEAKEDADPQTSDDPSAEPAQPQTPASSDAPSNDPTENPSLTPNTEATDDVSANPTDSSNAESTTDPSADPSADPSGDPDAETTPDPSAAQKIISGFAPLAMSEATLESKPTLEEVLNVLPQTLTAALSDGSSVDVAVTWNCGNFEAEADAYLFESALADAGYALGENVSMPQFTLRIQASKELVSGDFTYAINDDKTLMLTAYSGSNGVVSVPEEVDGMKVVAVAASAFAGNNALTEVDLPDTLIALEGGAFANCANLKKAQLPDSLEIVGTGVFDGCAALKFLTLNISLESTMTDAKGYTRRVVGEDNTVREVSVRLESDFTDYSVLEGGLWRVDGAILINPLHSASVMPGGSLNISASGSITVNGALSCAGSAVNEGVIIACGGNVSGIDSGVMRDHNWSDGVCSVCGARQATALTIVPIADHVEKTYDGTSGIDLSAEDFRVEGVREGDDVTIAAINTTFNESNAGSYLASVSFELGGANAQDYTALPAELSVIIHKKQVNVTPRADQSKVFGESDPTLRAGYRGVVDGQTLAGRLGREKGEGVGKYKITMGTLEESNPNYQIVLSEESFSITPKSISDASISVGRIPNQRYMGVELTPDAEVRDGNAQLRQGVDYQITYENNVEVGSAQATVSGMGNYGGSRKVSFRIIKVSGGSGSGMGFGVGSAINAPDFDEGSGETSPETYSDGSLILGEQNHGTILFDQFDQPHPFMQSVRSETVEEENLYWLCIDALESTDAMGVVIEGEYDQPRLRLSMNLIGALRQMGYTGVELTVGEMQARIPLATLYEEYVEPDGVLRVENYEVRLWQMDPEELTAYEARALEDYAAYVQPCHFELIAQPKAEDQAETPALPQDVLSLLEGVKLLFAPEMEPDYQNVNYVIVRADMEEPEMIPLPEGAVFIMDQEQVKAALSPLYGGMYALATSRQ